MHAFVRIPVGLLLYIGCKDYSQEKGTGNHCKEQRVAKTADWDCEHRVLEVGFSLHSTYMYIVLARYC